MENLKIDLVYCWCDIKDKNFRETKNKLANELNIEPDSNNFCRFIDNSELKYSLRSVEKNIPWINKIYIVTNQQIPNWLNTNHKKIKIIDHTLIIPEHARPNFNSNAIEHCIVNIPNLSEFFLYANDDCFFLKEVSPQFFFDKDNYPICRYEIKLITHIGKSTYAHSLLNAKDLIKKEYRKDYKRIPHHNTDAYRKSDIIDCYNKYKTQIDKTINNQFRTNEDISRTIYSDYACAISHGKYKILHNVDRDLPFIKQLYLKLLFKKEKDSFNVRANRENIIKRIKKYNPKLLCINDNEQTTIADRENIVNILEELFPQKSSFEL